MITSILTAVVKVLTGPLVALGGRYLDNQKDRERLRQGTDRLVYEADAAVRRFRLGHWMGRLPLFAAECAAAAYFIAILVDSTVPMDWLTPLELPEWFKRTSTSPWPRSSASPPLTAG